MPAVRVLLVCLANICRSPLAEAAIRQEADLAGLTMEPLPPARGPGTSVIRPTGVRRRPRGF